MKTSAQGKRLPRPISKSRWTAYATAGAATMIAGNPVAEAAIHYSGRVDVQLSRFNPGHATFQLDRPGHSIFFEHLPQLDGSSTADFDGFKGNAGSFRGTSFASYAYVTRLRRGDLVSQGTFGHGFGGRDGFGTLAISSGPIDKGSFAKRGIGFIAFAFDAGAAKRYGWARVRMLGRRGGNAFEILDYAYADPGEKIKAGQISSDGEMVEPDSDAGAATANGSLGLLAAGAVSLLCWRRNRGRLSLVPGR